MRHRPAFAYLLSSCAGLVPLLVALNVHAQEPDPAESAAATDPRASPDVQSQVGVGTEKEEEPAAQSDSTTAPKDGAEPAAEPEAPTFGHQGQFGLRSNLALGYKVMLRFGDSPPCDPPTLTTEEEKQVCGFATPPALDFGLSFALFDSLEPYLWFRMGLGEPEKTFTAATRWAGAGIRIYTMSDSQLKLFFDPAVAVAFEGAASGAPTTANYDTDFVGHVHFGLQYDFLEQLGLYFSAGPNVTFVRAIGTEFEAAVGLQVRGP